MTEYRDRRNPNARHQQTGGQRSSSARRQQAGGQRSSSARRQQAADRRDSTAHAQRTRSGQQAASGGVRRPASRTRAASAYQPSRSRGYDAARTARTAPTTRTAQASQARFPLPVLAVAAIALIVVVLVVVGIRSCAGEDRSADTAGTQATAVENDGSVVLTLLGDEDTVVLAGEEYIESGAQAIDRRSGQLTQAIQVEGGVDTSTPGTYQVTYTVQASDGMQAQRVRNVHVVEQMDADQDGIPVMMYHWVYRDDQPPDSDDTNFLSATKLEAQLQWLNEEGYYFPSHQEIRAYVDGTHSLPAKSVVLTFDDGEEGFLNYAIPLFNQYKVPATSYLIGDHDDTPQNIRTYASEYVSFQSHSYGLHNDGSSGLGHGGIIFDKTREEIVADERLMNDMLGVSPSFAYPYGDVSDDAPSALAEAGVLCAYTVNYGNVHKGDDPMRLNRVRVFGESPLEGFINQVETGE